MPNADSLPLKPATLARFDDRPLMAVGVLGFGVSIPLLTGLYGPVRPDDARFWLGFGWFIALAGAIWLGNRWLLFKQREHFDWFDNPWRKLAMLVTANVLCTVPLTVAALRGWYRVAGLPVDGHAIQVVALVNVMCVLFVTHAYETVFLIRERESDQVRLARLDRSRAEAELAALRAQVDPHFLFNSLNTLGHLVVRDPQRGRAYCDTLAEVYRYVLASRGRDLVPLADELDFLRAYHRLLALRFGEALTLELDDALAAPAAGAAWRVAPLALQTLLENAVKHNRLGDDAPLALRLSLEGDAVRAVNAEAPRASTRPTLGVGLANLDERCRLLTGRGLRLERGGGRFGVVVPVVRP